MGLTTFDEREPIQGQYTILPADGTANVIVVPAQTTKYRVDAILVMNGDTIAHVIALALRLGATYYQLGTVSVPAGSGLAGLAPVDLVVAIGPAQIAGYNVAVGFELAVNSAVAVTATHFIYVTALGGYI